MRRFLITGSLLAIFLSTPLWAETVEIPAARDATLIEDPDGALANGAGPFVFVGRTNQPSGTVRRALIAFDVAAALPEHAIVTRVDLTLFLGTSIPGARAISLHRVLADWGEGPSFSAGGIGAPSEPGDVTWLHTFYDQNLWEVSGGQFVGRTSARQVASQAAAVTWTSTKHLVQDVTLWLHAPSRNFGWILLGDESTRQTAVSLASHEHPDPSQRPVLSVTYRLPGEAPKASVPLEGR